MEWIPWVLGTAVAVTFLGVMFVVVGATLSRAWSGEAVGAMRVRKRCVSGTHRRLRVAVRRSLHGKAMFRDVHVLVGSTLLPADVILLSQVDAVRCAELLERAAAEAGSRT
jgi:hypothetical protein